MVNRGRVQDSRAARGAARRAAAAAEFALVLPFLMVLFLWAVDFSRVLYLSEAMTDCARNGALYAVDTLRQSESPYSSVTAAATAGVSNWNPVPTVSSQNGVDGAGASYVEVTVSYPYQAAVNYPGMPNSLSVSSTVRMSVMPDVPN